MTSAVPVRPRLKPTIEPFPAENGDVYLLRNTGPDMVIRAPRPGDRALLGRLDGSSSPEALVDSLRSEGYEVDAAEAEATLSQLASAGLLEDAADDAALPPRVLARFDRQLRYFADAGGCRASAQRALGGASVLLLGVGGLGCWTAYALTCAGLGRLTIVDGDCVEVANLNRQILFSEGDVGRSKADAAALRLRAFSSCTDVVALDRMVASPADVRALVEGHDVVVLLADLPVGELPRWVDEACFERGVPYVVAAQYPPLVRVGPLYVPGRTGCFACQEVAWRAEHPLYDEVDAWRRSRPSDAAAFGPTCGLIGSLLANEVVNLLTGIAPPAVEGRSLLLDANTLSQKFEEVPRRGECTRCRSER